MSKELETIKSFENKRIFDVTYDDGTQKHFETKTIGELFPNEINKIETELKDYELLKERTRLDSFECLMRLEEILPRGKELLIPVAKELKDAEKNKRIVDILKYKLGMEFNTKGIYRLVKEGVLSEEEYDLLNEVFDYE